MLSAVGRGGYEKLSRAKSGCCRLRSSLINTDRPTRCVPFARMRQFVTGQRNRRRRTPQRQEANPAQHPGKGKKRAPACRRAVKSAGALTSAKKLAYRGALLFKAILRGQMLMVIFEKNAFFEKKLRRAPKVAFLSCFCGLGPGWSAPRRLFFSPDRRCEAANRVKLWK